MHSHGKEKKDLGCGAVPRTHCPAFASDLLGPLALFFLVCCPEIAMIAIASEGEAHGGGKESAARIAVMDFPI